MHYMILKNSFPACNVIRVDSSCKKSGEKENAIAVTELFFKLLCARWLQLLRQINRNLSSTSGETAQSEIQPLLSNQMLTRGPQQCSTERSIPNLQRLMTLAKHGGAAAATAALVAQRSANRSTSRLNYASCRCDY